MFKKNVEVKETLLEKAIREAEESKAWEAASSLKSIQREENQRRSQEWRNGFFKGYRSGVMSTLAGVTAGIFANKRK